VQTQQTTELLRVQTYILVCYVTNQHHDYVFNRYSISISTPFEYLLRLD